MQRDVHISGVEHGPNACARDGMHLRVHADQVTWCTEERGPVGTGASFVPDADLLGGEQLFCRLTDGRESARFPVRHQPPQQLRPLHDEIFDLGRDGEVISIAPYFDGKALRYLLCDSLGEIDSRSGLLWLPTDHALQGEIIHVAAENSGGRVEACFQLTVEAAAAPEEVCFGAQTKVGEGGIKLAAAVRDPGPDFQLRDGILSPRRALKDHALVPLITGDTLKVRVAQNVQTVSSTKELQRFLDRNEPGVVRLRPGHYGPRLVIKNRPAQGVRVIEADDPDQPPVLPHVIFHKGAARARGGVTFRHIHFHNPDLQSYRALIQGNGSLITVENCEFSGDMPYAYEGFDFQKPQHTRGKAFEGRQFYDVVFRRNLVRNLVYGMDIAGKNILIEGCIFDGLYTDPIVLRSGLDGHSRHVEILDNEARNPAGDPSVLHYDFVQSYPGGGKGGLRQVRIAGNVIYWGPRGLRYPGNGNTGFAKATLRKDTRISYAPRDRERDLYLLDASDGPLRITLPTPAADMGPHANITLRRIDKSPHPIEVLGRGLIPRHSLSRQGNTNSYKLEGGNWVEHQAAPVIQGIFVQNWDEKHGVSGLVVGGNIFIGVAVWAIGIGTAGPIHKGHNYMRHVHVMNNSCLPQWPGDTDGDGRANEYHDGYHSGPAKIRTWAQAMRVERNIANAVTESPVSRKKKPGPIRGNDTFARDSYEALAARFSVPGQRIFAPLSRQEAVELATPPRRSRVPKGYGATAVWNFETGQPKINPPRLKTLPALRLKPFREGGWIEPISFETYARGRDISFVAEALPAGLEMTAEGVIKGRVLREGVWVAQVYVCNIAGFSEIRDVEIALTL